MKNTFLLFTALFAITANAYSTPDKNPILSRGKNVYSSNGNTAVLTNNKFGFNSWAVKDGSWLAIQLNPASEIFFNWNNPAYAWSNELAPEQCPQSSSFPVDYDFWGSSNSTNGIDGDWEILDSIRDNIVTARGHILNFKSYSWLKMKIIKGGGYLDEIEIFDVSNGNEDSWFFPGTSITANTYKSTPVPSVNFADHVVKRHSEYTPIMIRGGIGCISSTDLKNNLSKYLKMAGNVHFWAIEMGTNDAWGGTNGNVAVFKSNLQTIIDSCKVYGIQPILAKVLATNSSAAGWQVHNDFQKAIAELTENNNLIEGPDLFTWFLNNPDNLNTDGVHPNSKGAASIQRLWAEKMDSLYCDGSCPQTTIKRNIYSKPKVTTKTVTDKTSFNIEGGQNGLLQVYNTLGGLVLSKKTNGDQDLLLNSGLPAGVYIVKLTTKMGTSTSKFIMK